jgi:hypothetical protein
MRDPTITYTEARSQIQNGDAFLFEREGGLLDVAGAAISWWTRSKYVHVGMAIWLERRLFVLEAKDSECVRLRLVSDYLMDGRKTHWFKLADEWPPITKDRKVPPFIRSKMSYFGMTQLGDNYIAYWRLVWDFLILGRPRPAVRQARMKASTRMSMRAIGKPDPTGCWWCSELYAATIVAAGGTLPNGMRPAQASPESVAEFPFLEHMGMLTL